MPTAPAPPSDPPVRQLSGDRLQIIGASVALTQADIPYTSLGEPVLVSTTDVFVYADTVTLSGTLHNPGRTLQIVARVIEVSQGATLNVEGAWSTQSYAPGNLPQQFDQSPGAKGADGANGGKGGSVVLYAEKVTGVGGGAPPKLTIVAYGGKGGRGQDAQHGIDGKPGQWGVRPPPYNMDGGGWPGGDGGKAGDGGPGGDGGSVTIGIVDGLSDSALLATNSWGNGGDQGMSGFPGQGGHPAIPGPAQGWIMSRSGVNGAMHGAWPGRDGAPGPKQVLRIKPGSFTYADLVAQTILPQLVQLQQNADRAFRGKKYADAARLYALLMTLTSVAAGVPIGSNAPSKIPANAPNDIKARAAIYEASRTELSRLRQGLDFFGNRPDWVPALTLGALQHEIDQLLDLSVQLGTSFATLSHADADANAKRQALEDAQNKAENSINAANGRLAAYATALGSFEHSLAEQLAQIAAQLAANNDPGNPAYTAFVQTSDQQVRLSLLRRINDEVGALRFWSLDDTPLDGSPPPDPPTDERLEVLQTAHAACIETINDWKTAMARPFENFSSAQITFTRADHPSAFAGLEKSHKLAVAARVGFDDASFEAKYHVSAEKVRVILPDYQAQTTGSLIANVVHGGGGTYVKLDGSTVSFTHAPRPTLYHYDFARKIPLTDAHWVTMRRATRV